MSPLDFWSTFQIPKKDGTFLAASFFPKISLLGLIVCFALLRKLYRHFYPEPIHQSLSSQSKNQSANEKTALTLKGTLTNFEISTGAELQARFGSNDLLAIAMIKLAHARFTNVYVYEVEGNTVKETARLVYPD
ncbi:hypothetical protein PInf_020215 [Phytophthora infestans]|nr:hypothetical protein PInf_020215 [Phytophthora infestans]